MDFLELLDFSSFIIFSDDPWSLLVSFCQLFKLPLVVHCCNVICEWPLTGNSAICICLGLFGFRYNGNAICSKVLYPLSRPRLGDFKQFLNGISLCRVARTSGNPAEKIFYSNKGSHGHEKLCEIILLSNIFF